MSRRHPMAIVAGAATLLAAMPLDTVFANFTWLVYCTVAVVVIEGTAMLVRTARGPVWAQILAMMASLLVLVTVMFPSGEEFLRIFPTVETFQHFNQLLVLAGEQIRDEAAPVPDLEGLLLLTTAGVGLVGVLVDLAVVGIRRPALAGLPMLAIYSVPVAVMPQNLPIFPFIFAGIGFLWLLVADSVDRVRRFGRRFTGEGRDVDVWEPSPLSAAGRRLGVVSLIIAMVVPLAVPGLTSGLLDNIGRDGGGGVGPGTGGTGTAVDLTALLSDQLVRKTTTNMVKVTTTDPTPFYLRFGVADQLSTKGDGFVSRAPSGNSLGTIPSYTAPNLAGVSANAYTASIEVIDLNMPLAPTYQQVVGAKGLDGSWFFDGSTNQIFSRRSSATGRNYSVDFIRVGYTPNALRQAPTIDAQDPVRNLAKVPPIPQVTDLVAELVTDQRTEYDRVFAIYSHFTLAKNKFKYALETKPGDSGNPVVDFLNNREGFCVQYAAAMTWLVRAAGYPARVAFGFTRGNGLIDGSYTLTNLNLHAWSEVFFPGFGWVPFDATPSTSVVGAVLSPWTPDPNLPPPSVGPTPTETAGPVGGPPTLGPDERGGNDPGTGDDGATAGGLNPWLATAAAVVAVLLMLLVLPALRRRTLSRQRRARGGQVIVLGGSAAGPPTIGAPVVDPAAVMGARQDAHAAWAELLDLMVDFRVDVDDAETPRATAGRLRSLLARHGAVGEPAWLLASAEERARYAQAPLMSTGLDDAVSATRAALVDRASRWEHIWAVLMPRSVILRWRMAWVGWTTRVIRRTAAVREAVATLNPRRLLNRPRST